MTDIPLIETKRFFLRALEPADTEALFPTFADHAHMRWWSRGPFGSMEELAGWLFDPGWGGRSWAVVRREGGPCLARLVASDKGMGVSEIGYIVAMDHQGQGIATEALSALIAHLFRHEGVRRLMADTDPDNVPSNALLCKLGFTREGLLRQQWETHIGIRDSVLWGLLANEWVA